MPEKLDVVTISLIVEEIFKKYLNDVFIIVYLAGCINARKRKRTKSMRSYSMINRIPQQVKHLNRMVRATDVDCINCLRMNRNSFGRLCILLREVGGLVDGKYVSVDEQVAMFLGILAHHQKTRVIGFQFLRSPQTITHYVRVVLKSILKLHGILLVKPQPVEDQSTDPRWKWFKGCLGALDGTYINVMVSSVDKPRYRTRKGTISTNTLAVCDRNMQFVYLLPGWEGSAADSRVLRDAVSRVHGLKVPKGNYYLCDNGYANSEGFLTPYKNVRYHLKEWGPDSAKPQNPSEMFNMRHTMARNVIERAFGIMKMRWGILRSASYYPVQIQNRLIMACFLLHNFIRSNMEADPIEQELGDNATEVNADEEVNEDEEVNDAGYIDAVESSTEWNRKREHIAQSMWNSSS